MRCKNGLSREKSLFNRGLETNRIMGLEALVGSGTVIVRGSLLPKPRGSFTRQAREPLRDKYFYLNKSRI